jgi:hypothetical protein
MGMKVKRKKQRSNEATRHEGLLLGNRQTTALLLIMFAGTSQAFAVEMRAVRWDGAIISGQWTGSKDGKSIDIQTTGGLTSTIVDDLAKLEFPTDLRAPFGPVAFTLHDGGVMFGELIAGQSDAIEAKTAIGNVKIDWNELAAIRLAEPTQFKRANELFNESMKTRSPSQDVIISRDQADVKVLQGRLESLSENGGSFLFAGESRKFQNEKIFGIVFAAGATKPAPAQVLLELVDGSGFSGAIRSAHASSLRFESSFGAAAEIPMTNLRRLKFRSDRVQYVSDLKPATQRIEGVLHAPWAVRTDCNVLGEPISIGGRRFERGVGVHSRTELSYLIGGEFDRFAATIGIDDAVRPLGSVVMQIMGDGRTLFDSGLVEGNAPPRDILIDVTGVQSLTLLVDYGDGLDASDHADWGDARLLRPGKDTSKRNKVE